MASNQQLAFAIRAVNEADRALRDVRSQIDDIEGSATRSQGALAGMGNRLGTVVAAGAAAGAAGLVAFGVASVNAAADFEQAIDQVGAIANATERDMQALSAEALNIGRDTMFGATEAAQAMEILAANGIDVRDILGGAARAAVDLAAAGGTDLKTAADLASTSMAVWGLTATDMTEVVNRLAGAANVSRFGVEDMALAVAQGGGAAATAGVEFGDFTTSIAAIAPAFSSGSDAGTSFKTFLNALTPTSERASGAMEELGIITEDGSNKFFDASGNMRSMADIAGILHDATAGLTEQQRAMALETIFGSDAIRAAGQISQLTREDFIAMSDTMRDTSAQDVAAERMDNFRGSIDQLMGTIDTWMIQLGLVVLPKLNELVQFVNLEAIPAIEQWSVENQEELQAVADAWQVFADTVLPLLQAFVTSTLALFQLLFESMASIFLIFKGIFTLDFDTFLQGITGLVGAWNNAMQAQFHAVWGAINTITGGGLDSVYNQIAGFPSRISGLAGNFMGAGLGVGDALGRGLGDGFRGAWNRVAGGVNSAIPNSVGFSWPSVSVAGQTVIPGGSASIDLPDNPLPMLAAGGIVTGPTLALLGEAGPEAVIPLNRALPSIGGGVHIHLPNSIVVADDAGLRKLAQMLIPFIQQQQRTAGGVGLI